MDGRVESTLPAQGGQPGPGAGGAWVGALSWLSPWLLFAWLMVGLCAHPLPSPDLWWQLAGGREMVQGGRFPWTDSFSFTARGLPWMNHEWLAEVIMYGVYQAGSLGLLHLARTLLLFVVFVVFAAPALREGCRPWSAAAACAVCVMNAEWRYFFDVRPYLATYLFLGVTLAVCDRYARDGRSAWLLPLPAVFALWANLHSGVIGGLGMLVLLTVSCGRTRARALGACLAACVAATLANPFGSEVLTYPFEFLGRSSDWSRYLNEWARPAWLGAQTPFLVFVLLTISVAMVCRRHYPLRWAVVGAGFLGLACLAWRNLPLLAMVVVPIWAVFFDRLGGRFRRLGGPGWLSRYVAPITWGGAGLVGFAGLAWMLATVPWASLSLEGELFPRSAVAFLSSNRLPARLLNPYGWGGYFAWTLWPRYEVFMDGRASTLYPEAVYHDFLLASAGAPPTDRDPGWRQVLARYGVHVVVVNAWETLHQGHTIGRVIPGATGWRRIYADDLAEIYVDDSPATREARERYEAGQLWYPEAALLVKARGLLERGEVDRAERVVQQALARDAQWAPGWLLKGMIAVRRGDLALAEVWTRRALEIDPHTAGAHYNLGALRLAQGDRAGAIRELELELEVDPRSDLARERLTTLRGYR